MADYPPQPKMGVIIPVIGARSSAGDGPSFQIGPSNYNFRDGSWSVPGIPKFPGPDPAETSPSPYQPPRSNQPPAPTYGPPKPTSDAAPDNGAQVASDGFANDNGDLRSYANDITGSNAPTYFGPMSYALAEAGSAPDYGTLLGSDDVDAA